MGIVPIQARRVVATAACAVAVAIAGCGEDADSTQQDPETVAQQPDAAAAPEPDQFPSSAGKTLKELAEGARSGTTFVPATATFTPGENRVAFGLVNQDNEFLYAPTAIYIGRTPGSAAQGPYLAPADSLVTEEPYRSKTAALEGDPIASVYDARVPLPKEGPWAVLILSATGEGLIGTTTQLDVSREDPVPGPGDAPPAVETDTLAEAGSIERIDTRVPADTMHEVDFADVIGDRPVALLFATPQLCESRVCGPVTDIAEQLKAEYGDEVEFIHQEVYVDNDPSKGLRPPLEEFALRSEPWLFTFDAEGRVAARLEGSFGVDAFQGAVEEALG